MVGSDTLVIPTTILDHSDGSWHDRWLSSLQSIAMGVAHYLPTKSGPFAFFGGISVYVLSSCPSSMGV
jgi:hypothetical protein